MPRSGSSKTGTAVCAVVFYVAARGLGSAGADPYLTLMFEWMAAFCGLLFVVQIIGSVCAVIANRGLLKPTGIHGRVERLNGQHPKELGLHTDNDDGEGLLLGSIRRWWRDAPIFFKDWTHGLILAGTGAGKTSSLSKGWTVGLGKHHNRIITAKGEDLCVATYRYLTEELKHLVVCIDPYRLLKKHGIDSDDYNPCDRLLELANKKLSGIFDEARQIAFCLIPEAIGASGENKIFRSVSRQLIADLLVFFAVEQSETGELCCNLPFLRKLCSSDTQDLLDVFQRMSIMPDYDGAIARAGNRFLAQFKNNPKSAQSFIVEMQEALAIFEPCTPLGQSFEHSTFNASDIKNPNKNMSIFIILPPEKSGIVDQAAGVILNTLCTIAIEANSYDPPVTIIADEFEAISSGPLPVTEKILKIGRTRGLRLMAFVQDWMSLKAKYGDLAYLFKTQCSMMLTMDVKSVDDAEEYSKRSGQRAVVRDSANVSEDGEGFGVTVKEEAIPLLRQDEFNRAPKFTATLFKDAHAPLMLDLIHYKMVNPWVHQIDDIPGAPPEGSFPKKFKF